MDDALDLPEAFVLGDPSLLASEKRCAVFTEEEVNARQKTRKESGFG